MDKGVLFIYDHVYTSFDGDIYSTGAFSGKTWDRFFPAFSRVDVIGRLGKGRQKKASVSRDRVFFNFLYGSSFSLIYTLFFFKNLKLLFKLIRQNHHIVLRLPSFSSFLAFFCIIIMRKDYSVEVVGFAEDAFLGKLERYRFVAKLFDLFQGFLIKKATGALYVTDFSLQRRYPNYGLVGAASNVEIEVDGHCLANRLSGIFFPANYPKTRFKIGVIASLNANYKGVDDAILALARLRSDFGNFNIVLEVVGNGNADRYKFLASELNVLEYVRFVGGLSHHLVFEWLDTVDIYVQPSHTEGLPRALIEAMARGCPCVASSVGGIPELISQQYLHLPKNNLMMAECIKLLIVSVEARVFSAKENFERSCFFDSKILDKKRSDFYCSIIDL